MARIVWPLWQDQPCIEVVLVSAIPGVGVVRRLLADTGAGTVRSGFDIILQEDDCYHCGRNMSRPLGLAGAYVGPYPMYAVRVQLPALGYDGFVRSVGVPSVPTGVDGLAGFRFLNRFTYGNFGDPGQFGLER